MPGGVYPRAALLRGLGGAHDNLGCCPIPSSPMAQPVAQQSATASRWNAGSGFLPGVQFTFVDGFAPVAGCVHAGHGLFPSGNLHLWVRGSNIAIVWFSILA